MRLSYSGIPEAEAVRTDYREVRTNRPVRIKHSRLVSSLLWGLENKTRITIETVGGAKSPAKRSQNFNATYCNIVGRNMFRAFSHLVATCCDMLGIVGSNLKMVKFFMQHLLMMHDVVVVWPGSCNNVALGHAH